MSETQYTNCTICGERMPLSPNSKTGRVAHLTCVPDASLDRSEVHLQKRLETCDDPTEHAKLTSWLESTQAEKARRIAQRAEEQPS